eukprot:jgi/Chrzof1/7038/Cz02g08140.t1
MATSMAAGLEQHMVMLANIKDSAKQALKLKQYNDALDLYNQALQLAPDDSVLYSNRAAVWLMIGSYEEAVTDAHTATQASLGTYQDTS